MAEAVLAAAPPRFALAGLSMGGVIAHAIMGLAPERVDRLALIGTSARADTLEQTARRRQLIALTEAGRFAEVTPALLPVLLHSDHAADASLRGRVIAMAARIGPEAFARQATAVMGRLDRRGQLARYRVPTLIVCGRADAITPLDMHAEMTAAIPRSRFAIIEDCGHLSTMEQPQAVTALIRMWLQYASAPAAALPVAYGTVRQAGVSALGPALHPTRLTPSVAYPETCVFAIRVSSPVSARCGSSGSRAFSTARSSALARLVPRQKCAPKPNVMCGLGSRVMSKR
jgi:thioesterase domain-containing protein